MNNNIKVNNEILRLGWCLYVGMLVFTAVIITSFTAVLCA